MAGKSRIVLGHPYEGSFYWLMSAEDWRDRSIKSPYQGGNRYYETLYGSEPHKLVDITSSFALLYDEILLAPADCPLPNWRDCLSGSRYENRQIGLVSDWEWRPRSSEFENHFRQVMEDIEKHKILDEVPKEARVQIIEGIITQLNIAHNFKADVLGNIRYLQLCSRVQGITGHFGNAKISTNVEKISATLDAAFTLAGLTFSLLGLEDFLALRTDRLIQKYAKSFRKHVEQLPDTEANTEYELYKAMMDAIETKGLADKISGGLNIFAKVFSYASLIPIIGTALGVLGIGTDHGAQIIDKATEKTNWWLLAPRVSETLTKARIERNLKELEKKQ